MSVITVNQLVIDSFFLTDQWDAANLPTNGDVSRGLALLKYIIQASPSADIPFKSKFSWDLEPGKASYTFGEGDEDDFESKRIQRINFCFLTLNSSTYPIAVVQPAEYYSSPRVNTIQSMPQSCMLENSQGVSTVTLYPKPDQAYEFTMEYIKDLSDFTPQEPINNVPAYQLNYFRFALARQICMVYNLTWSELKEKEFITLSYNMKAANFHDMTVRTSDMKRTTNLYKRILSGF